MNQRLSKLYFWLKIAILRNIWYKSIAVPLKNFNKLPMVWSVIILQKMFRNLIEHSSYE